MEHTGFLENCYSVWDIENENESDTCYVGWRIFVLHYSECYAYFRIFKIMEDTLMEEITELKGINKKKLIYSLRKDKTNWLGEIPCFKTSCKKEHKEGHLYIELPFKLNDFQVILNTYGGLWDEGTNDSGNISFDDLDKQIEEMNKINEKCKKQVEEELNEEPPSNKVANGSDAPLEEDCICEKCNPNEEEEQPKEELTEESKIHEEDERETILLGLINLEVEKQMLKLKSKLFNTIKKEVENDFNFICNNYKNGNI